MVGIPVTSFCGDPNDRERADHRQDVRHLLLLLFWCLSLGGIVEGQQCWVSISTNPASPVPFGVPLSVTATLNGDVVQDNVTGSFYFNDMPVCALGLGPSSCSGTITASAGGPNTFTWSCSAIGAGGNGQNAGSQELQTGRIVDQSFFGMHLSTLSDPDQASLNVRFGTLRLWGSGVAWFEISPDQNACSPQVTPSCFDWTTLDSFLDWAQSYNYDVIYTFGTPPCWISPLNCQTDRLSNNSWASNIDHPNDWSNFVTALVGHSAARPNGRIKYYELWNEPTVPLFWTGTIETLAQMAQLAFPIIKDTDPQAHVLTPSPMGDDTSIPKWMDQYLGAVQALSGSSNAYADGVSFHSYQGSVPENVLPVIQNLQLTETNHGLYLPLFDTEGSWGNGTVSDPDEQAAFVARTYALQAPSVDRFAWYGWDFCLGDGNCWGPLWMRPGVSLSGVCPPDCGPLQLKSGMAYGTITDWLIGAQITVCSNSQGPWTCPIYRPNGYQGQILWSVSDSLSFTVPAPFVQSRDLLSNCPEPIQNQLTLGHKPLLVETPYPGSSGATACWWEAVQSILP